MGYEPFATTPAIRKRMQTQASADTRPELALRRELHRRGLRYRLHQRPIRSLRRTADITFASARVAVFVDGCFWHGCPAHGTQPSKNQDYWHPKILRNRMRDDDTVRRLAEYGWLALRVWEHEEPAVAADRIGSIVLARRAGRQERQG